MTGEAGSTWKSKNGRGRGTGNRARFRSIHEACSKVCLSGLLAISAGRTSKYVRSGNAGPSTPPLHSPPPSTSVHPSIHCYPARDIALIDPYSHNALLPRVPGYRITAYLIPPPYSSPALLHAAFVFDLLLSLAKLIDRHRRDIHPIPISNSLARNDQTHRRFITDL